jgi:hypothetical protein|tara:strand:+ start:5938 stop:6819 length:882 start_codon:yes stop_codon:yes gene_type:complete
MKKGLKQFIFYACVTLVIANGLAWGILYIHTKAAFYKPAFLTNQVLDSRFDYIILGSSIGLTTLNTFVIDSISQRKGINLSMDDTGLASQYLMLQHFLAENKETDYVILVLNSWEVMNTSGELSDNDYRFLPFVSRDYVYEHFVSLEEGFPVLSGSKYLPFLGVGYYNTELVAPSVASLFNTTKRNRFDERGNYVYPTSGTPPEKKFSEITLQFRNPYLDKIQSLCEAHEITIILYQPPSYKTEVLNVNTQGYINHSSLLKDKMFFYDAMHVNAKGREAASIEFAEEFKRAGN